MLDNVKINVMGTMTPLDERHDNLKQVVSANKPGILQKMFGKEGKITKRIVSCVKSLRRKLREQATVPTLLAGLVAELKAIEQEFCKSIKQLTVAALTELVFLMMETQQV